MLTFPDTDWSKELKSVLASKSVQKLFKQIDDEYNEYTILPKKENVFKAFELTSYQNTKVVILGQDPYPDAVNAMGLSFSVYPNVPLPRSLVNIYKERLSDVNIPMSTHGDLSNWAKQGVLLLNTTLTLREHKSNSHVKYGWNKLFTDKVIELLNNKATPVVFVLWGKNAHDYIPVITNKNHLVITSSHPSPLSALRTAEPFIGSKPFSRINEFLEQTGQKTIDWNN